VTGSARGICAAVLVFEGLVVFFAMLVALDLSDVDHAILWWVGGGALVACVALAGLLRRRWALAAASVLQVLLIGSGVVVRTMFFLGALFAGLWFLAIFLGRRVERLESAARPEPDAR
jgi:Protein of unknown function (DUF4233)